MGSYPLAPSLGFLHTDGYFLFSELAHVAGHASDGFTRQVDLDRINPVLGKHTHTAAHFFSATDNRAKCKL